MCSRKVCDDFDLTETFLKRRWHKLRGHEVEHMVRHVALAGGVAGLADGERRIEEQGLGLAFVLPGEVEERPAIAAREVGRIDISYGPVQLDALLEEVAHDGEHTGVDRLVGFVIGQLQANGIA
jgi:hypothetical protein